MAVQVREGEHKEIDILGLVVDVVVIGCHGYNSYKDWKQAGRACNTGKRASLALGRNANTGDILRVGFSLDGYEVSRRVSRKGRNLGPATARLSACPLSVDPQRRSIGRYAKVDAFGRKAT